MHRIVWVVVALAGCVSPNSVPCPSGKVCPQDTACLVVATIETCVTEDQQQACNGLEELARCVDNDDRFHCFDGVCIDACGNGHVDPGEVCDDGNKLDGDDCSARCFAETCGNNIIDLINGEQCDDGIAGLSGDGCSSRCQLEAAQWIDITPTTPSPRAASRIVRDTMRNRLIMFGGVGPGGKLAETWELTVADELVEKLVTPHAPPPRQEHGMAYDSMRDRIVVFGGYGPGGLLGDTWEFDGIDWIEITPPDSPTPRMNPGLAYDASRNRVVLFGGTDLLANGNQSPLADTWEWDGTNWTRQLPATTPTAAYYPALTYHPGSNPPTTAQRNRGSDR